MHSCIKSITSETKEARYILQQVPEPLASQKNYIPQHSLPPGFRVRGLHGIAKQKLPFSAEAAGPSWQDPVLQKTLGGCHDVPLLLVSPDSVSTSSFLLIWLQPPWMDELLSVKTLPISHCLNPD